MNMRIDMSMDINIEEVKKILLEEEQKIKEEGFKSIFDSIIVDGKNKHYDFGYKFGVLKDYGNKRYINAAPEISEKPEHVFIRSLASGITNQEITNFDEIVEELSNSDSELINYVIARNPNVSEQIRIKLATKKLPVEILIAIAENTKEVKLLEELFNTDNNELKIAILNNESFGVSPKAIEYYQFSIETFNILELRKLNSLYIPESLKEEFDYYLEIRSLESMIDDARSNIEIYDMIGEREVVEDYSYEMNDYIQRLNQLQKSYEIHHAMQRLNKQQS